MTLSRRRRLALLDWARHSGAWILEDDCDAEYRYAGPPVPALRSLDRSGSVVSVGTFSMVTFPALRIGYVIAPEPLVEAFTLARRCLTRQAPILEQAALHEFIDRGHFGRHVRRMRTLYGERREALLAALRRELPDCRPAPAEGGMHLALLLPPGASDVAIADAARHRDVTVRPLSSLSLRGDGVQGLLLGFAAVSPDEIERGVAVLRDVIAERTR